MGCGLLNLGGPASSRRRAGLGTTQTTVGRRARKNPRGRGSPPAVPGTLGQVSVISCVLDNPRSVLGRSRGFPPHWEAHAGAFGFREDRPAATGAWGHARCQHLVGVKAAAAVLATLRERVRVRPDSVAVEGADGGEVEAAASAKVARARGHCRPPGSQSPM